MHALRRVAECHDQRREGAVADEAADDEGMQAAVEHRLDEFDRLRRAALPSGRKVPADLGADAMDRAFMIVYRRAEGQVGQHFAHRGGERAADAVNADGHGARGAADMGGAKFDLRIDADGAEQIARH